MDGSPLIRSATVADAAVLGAMRAVQQVEIEGRSSATRAAEAAYALMCRTFFARELGASPAWIFGWLATGADGVAVGAAVLTLAPGIPRLGMTEVRPDGRIRNVYVVPDARRRGLGRALTLAAIEAATARGVTRLTLGATSAGRPTYAALGFVPKDDEMLYAP